MPIFELECKKCKKTFDFYKLKESSKVICPNCGNNDENEFEKNVSAPAVHFKGFGWSNKSCYETVDPTSVKGIKRIDNPTKNDEKLYKNEK